MLKFIKELIEELELKLIHKVVLGSYFIAVIIICIKNIIYFINH